MKYFLSLGSNVGQRRHNIARAIKYLEEAGVKILKASSLYETQPVGFTDQACFYNQVVEVATNLNPHEFLALAKKIEAKLKRERTIPHGPRTIDIDLLLAGKAIIKTNDLTIPHLRLTERRFVLEPLNEIAPETVHPEKRKKIRVLLREIKDTSWVIRLKEKRREFARKANWKKI